MKLSGFHSTEWLPPPKNEHWRFSNIWDLLPQEVSAAAMPEPQDADILICGNSCFVHPRVQSLVQVRPPKNLVGWEALSSYGQNLEVSVSHTLERPLRIRLTRHSEHDQSATLAHLKIKLAEKVKLTIHHEIQGSLSGLSVGHLDFELMSNAQLEHAIVLSEGNDALNVMSFTAKLNERAQLNQTLVARGGKMVRINSEVHLIGTQAHVTLTSLAELAGDTSFDLNSTIFHHVSDCTADQLAKNLLRDNSKAVFSGKIHIARHAIRTFAKQLNRNLLLSDKAKALGQPQLEILADDVKCSHGSTTGQLDDEALFYLTSRGLSQAAAHRLLTSAFVTEVLNRAQHESRIFLGRSL